MDLKHIGPNGEQAIVSASDEVFGRDYNEPLIHQIVVAFQANARLGTRAQKDRATVAHTTKKPWRQKGTGRARAGMSSSPLWRGGGKAFPSSPDENFTQKVNKKMYRAAMRSIYSQLARESRLQVVDSFAVDAPKTKLVAEQVRALGLEGSVLVISHDIDDNLYLGGRNLANFAAVEPRHADPVALIRFDTIVVTKVALAQIEEMFA